MGGYKFDGMKSGVSTFRSSTGGVSALGRTNLHFVDPGVKVNGQYYRDMLLTRDLLPDIKQYSNYFTFQQDGAPGASGSRNCRTNFVVDVWQKGQILLKFRVRSLLGLGNTYFHQIRFSTAARQY